MNALRRSLFLLFALDIILVRIHILHVLKHWPNWWDFVDEVGMRKSFQNCKFEFVVVFSPFFVGQRYVTGELSLVVR